MKKRTLTALFAVTALSAAMMAGCAGKAEKEAATTAEETTTEAAEETTEAAKAEDESYEPVTITLNLERSGLGENVEYTFTEKPSAVVASGDQMADFFV